MQVLRILGNFVSGLIIVLGICAVLAAFGFTGTYFLFPHVIVGNNVAAVQTTSPTADQIATSVAGKLEPRFDAVNASITAVKTEVAKVTDVTTQLANITIPTMQQVAQRQSADIGKLQADYGNVLGDQASLRGQLESLTPRVTAIGTKIDEQTKTLVDQGTKIDGFSTRLTALTTAQKALDDRVAMVENKPAPATPVAPATPAPVPPKAVPQVSQGTGFMPTTPAHAGVSNEGDFLPPLVQVDFKTTHAVGAARLDQLIAAGCSPNLSPIQKDVDRLGTISEIEFQNGLANCRASAAVGVIYTPAPVVPAPQSVGGLPFREVFGIPQGFHNAGTRTLGNAECLPPHKLVLDTTDCGQDADGRKWCSNKCQ